MLQIHLLLTLAYCVNFDEWGVSAVASAMLLRSPSKMACRYLIAKLLGSFCSVASHHPYLSQLKSFSTLKLISVFDFFLYWINKIKAWCLFSLDKVQRLKLPIHYLSPIDVYVGGKKI